MPRTIAVLTNENCPDILKSGYFLGRLARIWHQQGIRVHTSAGCVYKPADMAILHVDTTVVEDEYMELAERYPVAVNGGVKDISKSSFSTRLLKQTDAYEGPVIVKTDANYGGAIEYDMRMRSGRSVYVPEDFERPWRKRETLDSYNYPVFDGIRDVPQGVWKNRHLVVEKFLPERTESGEYRSRGYLFLGGQELGMWFNAPQQVIKGSSSTSRGTSDEVPQVLRDIRKSSGFAYGRFDYTEVDGEINLFDKNKTPALGALSLSLVSEEKMLDFANAILDFS
jgi:hypothetical protein